MEGYLTQSWGKESGCDLRAVQGEEGGVPGGGREAEGKDTWGRVRAPPPPPHTHIPVRAPGGQEQSMVRTQDLCL